MSRKLRQLQNATAHDSITNLVCLGQRTNKLFATAGDDLNLHLWTVGSHNPRVTFGPLQSPLTACIFNPSESQLLCGNASGTIMLYDLNESRCSSTWTAHSSSVTSVAFHPQNPSLVVCSGADGKLTVLSTQQRLPFHTYNSHNGKVNHVCVSGDGRYIASCGDDKTVRIFDLTAQREFAKFTGHSDRVHCIDFHHTEPLLISCGADRSTRFFDVAAQSEIAVSFPLDSSPVSLVRFCSTESAAFSASSDYLKVVGWKPPELYDHFPLGLERVHDISFVDGMITIASTTGNRVLIHRMNGDMLKPFAGRKQQQQQPVRSPTPRLLDISAMTKRISAGSQRQETDDSKVFQDFRKPRATFMTAMNDRFARLTRVAELIDRDGLGKTLEIATKNGDLGVELLAILRMKPNAVKLDEAPLVMQIAVRISERDVDLAVASVEGMLQAFGKLVHATRSMGTRGDEALMERKRKCEHFVEAFREIAPILRSLAASRAPIAQTATELLEEWRIFLR